MEYLTKLLFCNFVLCSNSLASYELLIIYKFSNRFGHRIRTEMVTSMEGPINSNRINSVIENSTSNRICFSGTTIKTLLDAHHPKQIKEEKNGRKHSSSLTTSK